MINAFFQYAFMRHAFIAVILASIVCGIIGTIVVEKKLVMMSGGIAHTAFGGIGMGYFLGIEPMIGALIFSVLSSLGIAKINRSTNTNSDTLIGMFWSLGMALGIIFIAFTPGYPPDMNSYLFGNILRVSSMDVKIMGALDVIVVAIIVILFNYFKAYLFDDEFTQVLGINTSFLEYLTYVTIACTIVVLIRVVGIILVIALLTVPPAIAKQFTFNLKSIMIVSSFLGIIFGFAGLAISYYFNIASGASIIIVAVASYVIISFLKKLINKKRGNFN
ncbi:MULTISPECIES: metal ABC transporter permease [Clostridium]|uniref:Zinc ABC transporter, permease protein n=1 Tax=Clostridium novyi (strain NT) TaxID=386415 RepID=A0PXK4_CLONN|nr:MULTISPECIES: metal ABC transporter permease [Clostridium]ABK62195.1 Zinc ABC transporter, permease protein [Clostridium novyi NT]KEH87160.1 membrane protein [Clostridium novyi A str. NCTC 538]KEH89857.1 membrane protein [Clostridium novyi A str. 4540]KEH90009.1 membrane protein [Clostridium novyi A str. BKT29909]KEH94413.1 membrane protein [Clostridium novyi A str. GD211209]